jgi:hypothetical protein
MNGDGSDVSSMSRTIVRWCTSILQSCDVVHAHRTRHQVQETFHQKFDEDLYTLQHVKAMVP